MKLKIKTIPEDFVVEELAGLALEARGDFGVYLLEKRGWNTVGALIDAAAKLKISFKYFSYGGKKDRHSLTTQYISIKGAKVNQLEGAGYSLKFRGFMDRPMGPDLIEANKFKVTVRALELGRAQRALSEIESIESFGYPNYFDDQRFGSYDAVQGFLAEKLLKGHFSGALKIYLTAINPRDKKKEKEEKGSLRANWEDWKKGLGAGKITQLLKRMPKERLSIYFSAYQAYIWNEVLRNVIKQRAALPLKIYPGFSGDYYFYTHLEPAACLYLKEIEIPLLAGKTKMPDDFTDKIYSQLLEERGIKSAMFNRLKVRQAFFKTSPRKALVKPESLSFKTEKDEMNVAKEKLTLEFSLPRGSYGTMLLKRLFSDNV